MFNNQSDVNKNQPNNKSTPSLFATNAGGLFGKPKETPASGQGSGGLFGSVNATTSLFSLKDTASLKTSQRKQGGLFGSVNTTKAPVNQQAPKLNFGGLGGSGGPSLLFGSNQSSIFSKKQQSKPTPTLFSANENSTLFSKKGPAQSGSLFGSMTQKTLSGPGQQPTSQNPSGGLFSKVTPANSVEAAAKQGGSLFGGNNSNTLFNNSIRVPLFGDKRQDKKQVTVLFGNTPQPPSLSNMAEDSMFGNKKAEQKKQAQKTQPAGGLFSSNTTPTPSTPLFGPKSPSEAGNVSQQIPKFNLVGNLPKVTPNQTSRLLSNKSIVQSNKAKQSKNMEKDPKQGNTQQKPTLGLFGGPTSKPKEQAQGNAGSLFGGNTSLFSTLKTQTKAQESGSLFSLNKQPHQISGQKRNSPGSILFGQGQSSLTGRKQTESITEPNQLKEGASSTKQGKGAESQAVNFPAVNKSGSCQPRANKESQRVRSGQSRTISFNEAQDAGRKIQKPEAETQKSLSAKSSLFSQIVYKPQQAPKIDTLSLPSVSQPVTGLMAQQSFFKADSTRKQAKQAVVFTAFQIDRLIRQKLKKRSGTSDSRSPSQLLGKDSTDSIQEWMQVSFGRCNQMPTPQTAQIKFPLHQNQDINRFLNDICRQVVLLVNLPPEENSFRLVNKLFFQLLDKLGIKQYLFNCTKLQACNPQNGQQQPLEIVQLNTTYFLKHQMYTFTPEAIQLNLQSAELQQYIASLTKKFITNQLEYLDYVEDKLQLLRLPHSLFYDLLSYCLHYKKMRLCSPNSRNQKQAQLVGLVQDFQKKTIRRIVATLSKFVAQYFYSFSLINKQNLPTLIRLLEDFSYTEEEDLVDLALKVILSSLELALTSNPPSKSDVSMSAQLRATIKETKSLQLLPFRTLVHILENNSQRLAPSSHDLYRYIKGPQWVDWLQIYLSGPNEKQVAIAQAGYLTRILECPSLSRKRVNRQSLTARQTKYIRNLQTKILSRKRPIFKLIMALKEENMLNLFYEILTSLICDYDSYRRTQELFFKQKDQFNYEFRSVIAEVSNYPSCRTTEEIPFMHEKVLYFFRIVEVAPERTLALERLIFEGQVAPQKKSAVKEQEEAGLLEGLQPSDWGHKICHLIIDSINYFGIRGNQRIVSKCLSAIRSLLQNEQTSLPMKIAMAVNKPQLFFSPNSQTLSSIQTVRLSQALICQMTELLEYFLASQEFPQMLGVNLRTNNSQGVQLERMYSVRYSGRDYLPFAKALISQQSALRYSGKVLTPQQPTRYSSIVLTYSSYWFFKALEVLVQAVKQQKLTVTSNDRSLLYLLNLILEKFLIPFSHRLQGKMQQQSSQNPNNPIYSTSSQNQIPKVLQYLAQALNTVDIMAIVSQNLRYKLVRSGHIFVSKSLSKVASYYLTNQKLQEDYASNQYTVFLSVKILKQLLETYRIYEQYKNAPLKFRLQTAVKSGQSHFVYKLLCRLKWIQQLEFSLFMKSHAKEDLLPSGLVSGSPKANVVIGLVALLLVQSRNQRRDDLPLDVECQGKPVNLKQHNYEKPYIVPIEGNNQGGKKALSQLCNFSHIQNFYTQFGNTLNYESINNFLVNSSNPYLESYESSECLSIQCLSLLVSGQALLGDQSANTHLESSINIYKCLGLHHATGPSGELFSNIWLLQNLQNQLFYILISRGSSLQIKQSILDFLYQMIKCDKAHNNFMIGKKVFYKYLVRHLDQFSLYTNEQMNRLNLYVVKIINVLQDKDYCLFSQQVNDKLVDSLLSAMLQSCSKCLKSSGNLLKLIKSFGNKEYYPSELAYYHLQRTVEQRQIINTGQAYNLLKQTLEIVEKRFFDNSNPKAQGNTHRWRCIQKINSLIISLNLSYLTSTIIDQDVSKLPLKYFLMTEEKLCFANTRLPRSFTRNPLEVYLIQATSLSSIYSAFAVYKQNLIDWLSFYAINLGEKALRFLNWMLTVDKTLYGNQPVSLKSRQLQSNKHSSIICSLHMGSYRHTAVELFADTASQAINMVKNLYDESFRNLQKGMTVNQTRCFSIMGYCLEWIRARQGTSDILQHSVKNTIMNPFWLDHRTAQNTYVIKFLLSIVSIARQSMANSQFQRIRAPILDLIHKFKQGKSQLQQTTIQELISVLISIPPQIQDGRGLNQVLNIWRTQTNNQFFYNQSRLVLQLSYKYPNQVARLKVLSSCQKINRADFISQYSYNLRYPDAITLTWALKIACALMSSQIETVVVVEETSQFYQLKSQKMHNFLLKYPTSISLAYLEQLQALLQFFMTLVSSQAWLVVHRQQFQKLTYIISHKLINLFTDFINSKVMFVAESDMQRRFRKIRYESYTDQTNHENPILNKIDETSTDKDSVFKMLMQIKMMECMKTYTLLLSHCFQQSWYVHKYFNEEVFQNYRYGVSFWDRMNKSINDMIRYDIVLQRRWRKMQNINLKLALISDCINSSEYFVQTGYLSSIFSIPQNSAQLFEQLYELNLVSFELATIHLIQQKSFRQKFQCLMKGNIQKYAKKLFQSVKQVQNQFQLQQIKTYNQKIGQIKRADFQNISKNIANLIRTI